MKRKIEIQDELNELGSSLANMEKKTPFKVPENYFASLPQVIKERVSNDQSAESIVDLLSKYLPRPQYAIGSLVIFILVFVLFFENAKKSSNDIITQIEKLQTEEVNTYLAENLDDFDEITLIYEGNVDIDALIDDVGFEDLSEDYINNYLLNSFDETTLKEELL